MTKEQFFLLLLKMKRNERVYICPKTDYFIPINWNKNYDRNDLFVNPFGDIITKNGNYVGNLIDYDIIIS